MNNQPYKQNKGQLDPNEIPDNASGKDLAAFVLEDITRQLALGIAALAAIICSISTVISGSSNASLRTITITVGLIGTVTLLLSQLLRWNRVRQWFTISIVLAVCGGLLIATLFINS